MAVSKSPHDPAKFLSAFWPNSRILAVLLLVAVVLASCADDQSDRQFAGDEQATGPPEETAAPQLPTQRPGTPLAVASPLSEQELFSARGMQTITAMISKGIVYVYDASDDGMTTLPVGSAYNPWIVDVSPDQQYLALLVSPAESLVQWRILVFDVAGELQHELPVVGGVASPIASSEVVATGTGGMDWSPDGSTIAVALPTGGIYAVGLDGDVEQMSSPIRTARPGTLAWSPTSSALAFASQINARSGLGLSLAPATAYPLDAVQLLRPDPTGNRSVSYLEWFPGGSQIIAIVDRMETGDARGDVFAIAVDGSPPDLIWTAELHTDAGAESVSVSPDGSILAVLSKDADGESIVALRQLDGPSEVQQALGATLERGEIVWTDRGIIVVGGPAGNADGESSGPVIIRIDEDGEVSKISPAATPVASPRPAASPAASPVGSPVAVPAASAVGSPVASPIASPPASPIASPGTAEAVD